MPFTRRNFLRTAPLAIPSMAAAPTFAAGSTATQLDIDRMRALVDWTMLTMSTPNPVPFGAEIFNVASGKSLVRAANAVGPEHDPSAHGEVHAMRLGCAELKSPSLRGHVLYTTCEPCPMCMACALWAGLDRVVFGATIADATRYGHQIQIPAAEVAQRTDMRTVVDGPVMREYCLRLFTDPRMQAVFAKWNAARD